MTLPLTEHGLPGRLIVIEGLSRCGKTSFIRRCVPEGTPGTVHVAWNNHPLVSPLTSTLKAQGQLDGLSFCLLHLLDARLTLVNSVLPALKAGLVVIADRYVYTSWVRDRIRGVSDELLLEALRYFVRPDLVLYLDVADDEALRRFRMTRQKFGEYGSGQDVFKGSDSEEAFTLYTQAQRQGYREIALVNNFVETDHEVRLRSMLHDVGLPA